MLYDVGKKTGSLEDVSRGLREAPLPALRQMLKDEDILDACEEAGHEYRRRMYGPVVTVFHFLLQAIQREGSFAATWEEIWATVISEFGLKHCKCNSSTLSQARSRFPKAVFDILIGNACEVEEGMCEEWRGYRLLGLDCGVVSMPREKELFEHFGTHRARSTAVRYPLGTFCSLLSLGSMLMVDHRFGRYDPGEIKTATPLLKNLAEGDLLLADRSFAGSPTLARIRRTGADFLMRKNGRLKVEKLRRLERLGREDFLSEIPMSRPARKADPSLPESVRVRIFKAKWTTPAGEKLQEWFVTSLEDPRRFRKRTLAKLYHQRWRMETSYQEFKVAFHSDVLRSKTVDNVRKEFAAHVLAYQLVRRLILKAAGKHKKKPTRVSFLNAVRWVLSFSSRMSIAPAWRLPSMYRQLLDAIASTEVDVRPGRLEPRAFTREWKHYPRLRMSRSQWRRKRLKETA